MNKNKQELPKWFPLEIYSKKLTAEEWINELMLRMALETQYANIHKESGGMSKCFEAFLSVIIENNRGDNSLIETPEKNFFPVRDAEPFNLLYLTQHLRREEYSEVKIWAERLYKNPKRWLDKFYAAGFYKRIKEFEHLPISEEDQKYYTDVVGKGTAVWIDLDYSDETLKLAFEIWLVGVRSGLGEKAKQSPKEKDFEKWSRYGLLPAYDLAHWAKLKNLKYTDAFLARSLWPDSNPNEDFVDVTERFRKVTKPMLNEVLNWNFIMRFERELELYKAMEVLFKKMKAE